MRATQCSLLLIAAAIATACHSTNRIAVPQPGTQLEGNPPVVSVMRQDRSVLTIYRPQIKGDSLVGWLDPPRDKRPATSPVAVNLADVREISVREIDPAKTTGLAVGTVALVAGLAVVAFYLFIAIVIHPQ